VVLHVSQRGRNKMSLFCPFCTREITLDAAECPWCGTSFGSDTRKFIRRVVGDLLDEDPGKTAAPCKTTRTFRIAFPTPRTLERSYIFEGESGGLYIRTDNPPPQGERFRLKIRLPNGERDLEVWCEVVWSQRGENGTSAERHGPGMGVKFLDISQDGKKAIMTILCQALC
jgi:uncharacterized protein (TIGR02266 family)